MDTTKESNTKQLTSSGFQRLNKQKKQSTIRKIKKILYFLHFLLIAVYTTYVLIEYPHCREKLSFTLLAMIFYGYMAIWTIIANFLLLLIDKQNWAVMFDRLIIKFLIMAWPIAGIISYTQDTFLYVRQIAIFTLYMGIISILLIIYQIYTCTFDQHKNPDFIFQPNDLNQVDEIIWDQRKKYNQSVLQHNKK